MQVIGQVLSDKSRPGLGVIVLGEFGLLCVEMLVLLDVLGPAKNRTAMLR